MTCPAVPDVPCRRSSSPAGPSRAGTQPAVAARRGRLAALAAALAVLAALSALAMLRTAVPAAPAARRVPDTPPPPLAAAAGRAARRRRPEDVRPAAEDWARPRVLHAFGVPCGGGAGGCVLQLFVLTQGLYAPAMGWELRVVGCAVGGDVYPLAGAYSGTYECLVPRRVEDGEEVTVVLDRTPAAERLRVSGATVKGVGVVHEEGDLVVATGDDGRLRVRSAVVWAGQVDAPPPVNAVEGRYELCVATQEKAYPEDLHPHWLEYHRRLGVDMFYIYDNHAEGAGITGRWTDAADVEVLYWPHVKSQLTAHAHILVLARRRCEWLLLVDVDEWVLVAGTGDGDGGGGAVAPLKRSAATWRARGDDMIHARDIAFGPSGHQYRPDAPMPEAYTHLEAARLGKPIVRTDAATPDSKVHHIVLRRAARKTHVPRKVGPRAADGRLPLQRGEIYLAHYKHRSWEDYVRKGAAGRNSIFVADWTATRGAADWRADSPPKGYVGPPAGSTPWHGARDAWRAVMSRRPPPQVLARSEGGLRCAAAIGRAGVPGVGPAWGALGTAACGKSHAAEPDPEYLRTAQTYGK
jgi:Glycosyl transferase family 2